MPALPVAAVLVALAAGLAPPQGSQWQPPLPPLLMPETQLPAISLVGPNSGIHERRLERIRDEKTWQEIWGLHAKDVGPRAAQGWLLPPRVDFRNYEVIAFFRGDSINDNGEVAESLLTAGDLVVLRFDSITFQSASSFDAPPNQAAGVASTPYGIWVIPRSSKPIAVEENVQDLKDNPAQWQLQRLFPAAPPDDGC